MMRCSVKIKTISPKDVWLFFTRSVGEKDAVFLLPEKTGLSVSTTDDLTAPPDTLNPDIVRKKTFIVFLKILIALKGGRPVKLIPSDDDWSIYYGPKP